jgi:hypothetical protein
MKLERYISPTYLKSQMALHQLPKGYGGRGDKWAGAVTHLAKMYKCKTILDYGCGQGTLKKALKPLIGDRIITEYDPAIKLKRSIEKGAVFDMVVCTDVLEHIEPDKLPIVIDHLFNLSVKILFLVVATRPSKKFFPDGRNVHLIIQPDSWWKERLTHPHFRFVDNPPRSPMDVPSREWIAVLERMA